MPNFEKEWRYYEDVSVGEKRKSENYFVTEDEIIDFASNYDPQWYQSKGWLPLKDYTDAALNGDLNEATRIAKSIQPLREIHAKCIMGYWNSGRMPIAEMKYWQELIGMNGGNTRPPVIPMTEEKKIELKSDLTKTGLFEIV